MGYIDNEGIDYIGEPKNLNIINNVIEQINKKEWKKLKLNSSEMKSIYSGKIPLKCWIDIIIQLLKKFITVISCIIGLLYVLHFT